MFCKSVKTVMCKRFSTQNDQPWAKVDNFNKYA